MEEDIISSGSSTRIDETSITSDESIEFEFVLENGKTGIKAVSDPLLDTEAIAEQRAMSEFLKNSYQKKQIQFTTYRTVFKLNDIIEVEGLPYLIKNIEIAVTNTSIKSTISGVRYE